MSNLKIAIIDYQLSNLYSVGQACLHVGLNSKITSNFHDIDSADALILPGVGAFGDAMKNIAKLNLISSIKKSIDQNKPFLGVCLGMQLLFETSEEFGTHQGLGIIKGKVVKFPNKYNVQKILVPQIGWNRINITKKSPILDQIKNQEFMYFVHSFYTIPSDQKNILTTTNYENILYTSAIASNNILAVQFHPEKSGHQGLKIYKNFQKIVNNHG